MRLGQEVQTLPRTARLTPATTRGEARDALAKAIRALGLEAPEREAALLVVKAAGLRAIDLIGAPEAPLGQAAARVEAFAARRLAGEPLSRILGRREFWGLEFQVTPDVLDPRADTETIVEATLKEMATRRGEPLRILDLGVGAGAILGALLTEFMNARGVGVDLSPAAAAIAESNLRALGLAARVEIRVGAWGEGLKGPFDLIVSNPPYIATSEIAGLEREVRDHDPRLALDGGVDGLDAYRVLAPQIARLLAPDEGRFALEFGQGQGPRLREILARSGLRATASQNDLSGVERVIVGARQR